MGTGGRQVVKGRVLGVLFHSPALVLGISEVWRHVIQGWVNSS